MAPPAEMNARQRKHVYMHSTIFDTDGPAPKSVYAPGRQHELYDQFADKLASANRQPPELVLPKAEDVKCTQMAGHNAVLPRATAAASPELAPAKTSSPEVLVYDGEARPVVRAAGKDHEIIPKEFWSTSSNLQWHDTRNEQCRGRNQGPERQGLCAAELKRQELSSEVFGKQRLTDPSTAAPRHELLADSADYLRMDSALHARRQQGAGAPPEEVQQRGPAGARARLHQNLASSQHNTMPRPEAPQGPQEVPPQGEDPSTMDRRRQEKNFSDLFGAQMGERKDVRGNRHEVTAMHGVSFLDTRGEIAGRNKDHWRHDPQRSTAERKVAERDSNLFDYSRPERPLDPQADQVFRQERTCWDSKDGMHAATETARRHRMKDHLADFEDREGRTHANRKQDSMASTQVRLGMGASEPPTSAWEAPTQRGNRGPGPSEREALLRSAKDTKLASLQSSIFS